MTAKLDLQDVVGLEEAVCAVWEMQPEACPLREVFTDNLLLVESPLRFDGLPDGFFREAYPKAHRKLGAVRYGASLLKRWVSPGGLADGEYETFDVKGETFVFQGDDGEEGEPEIEYYC
jgi:hypothetical protein